jgi:hypothetical protein
VGSQRESRAACKRRPSLRPEDRQEIYGQQASRQGSSFNRKIQSLCCICGEPNSNFCMWSPFPTSSLIGTDLHHLIQNGAFLVKLKRYYVIPRVWITFRVCDTAKVLTFSSRVWIIRGGVVPVEGYKVWGRSRHIRALLSENFALPCQASCGTSLEGWCRS